MKKSSETLIIKSRYRDYPVVFVEEFSQLRPWLNAEEESFFVVDDRILGLNPGLFENLQAGDRLLPIAVSEETKTLYTVEYLARWLADRHVSKSSTVVAVGGGAIQDLVSFTCHIFHRGVDWVYIPTTLLSQADSCIGSKSGINILPYKNQIGAVHAPREIVLCEEFLNTLDPMETLSGLGEILKLSLTSSRAFFEHLEHTVNTTDVSRLNLGELTRLSLSAKQEIIEADEYETDLRRILNYGHSFGHALEAITDHKVPHGIAVAWGIAVINALGVDRGITPKLLEDRVNLVSRKLFDFVIEAPVDAGSLINQLKRDKKVRGSTLHAVIPSAVGALEIIPISLDRQFESEIEKVLQNVSLFRSD